MATHYNGRTKQKKGIVELFLFSPQFIYLLLQREKQKETVVGYLGNILPQKVIQRLKGGHKSTFAENFPNCTVMFATLMDFATLFDDLSPSDLVEMLDTVFSGYEEWEGAERSKQGSKNVANMN